MTEAPASSRSRLNSAESLGTGKPTCAMMSRSATVPAVWRPIPTPGSEG